MCVLSETIGGISRTGGSGLAYKSTDIIYICISFRKGEIFFDFGFSPLRSLPVMLEAIAVLAGVIVNIIYCRCSKYTERQKNLHHVNRSKYSRKTAMLKFDFWF